MTNNESNLVSLEEMEDPAARLKKLLSKIPNEDIRFSPIIKFSPGFVNALREALLVVYRGRYIHRHKGHSKAKRGNPRRRNIHAIKW